MKRTIETDVHKATTVKKKLKYSNAKEIVTDLRKEEQQVKLYLDKHFWFFSGGHDTYELKSFALTLSFYSLRTYKYVRKTFELALPHPSTLRNWYKCINCQPGFTDETLAVMSIRVQQSVTENKLYVHLCLTRWPIENMSKGKERGL